MEQRDTFFAELRGWAKHKHEILGKYLRLWSSKLGTRSPVIAFVDTCAGEGRYDDGKAGSPLIALEMNKHLIGQGKRLLVVACEHRDESYRRLVQNLAPYINQSPPLASVLKGKFPDLLPDLVALTADKPSLFFIDPYGLSDLTPKKLAPLLDHRLASAREPTELLVRVPHGLFARFAGWLYHEPKTERNRRLKESFRRLVATFAKDANLVSELESRNRDRHMVGVELMYSYLSVFEDRFRYVTPIEIREGYFETPRYYLVHCTDSPHGVAYMNDVVSRAEDWLFEEVREAHRREQEAGGQQAFAFLDPLPDPVRQLRHSWSDLKEAVVDIVGGRELQHVLLRAELALRFGPDFRAKDHNRVIRDLVAAGDLVVTATAKSEDYRRYRRKMR